MKNQILVCCSVLSLSVVLLGASVGCDKKQAEDAVKSAEDAVKSAEESAGKAADGIADGVGDAVKEGGEMASELGEQAMGFVAPLKEKFGSLDSLKDKPEELKTAVSELIQTIEEKAAGIELPEAMSTALATVKEKLVSLQKYLEGEVEQANIDERLKDIGDSVKSGLGL